MDHLQKFTAQVRSHLLIILLANNFFLVACFWYVHTYQHLTPEATILLLAGMGIFLSLGFMWLSTRYFSEPLTIIRQAVLHISPETADQPAPNLARAHLGKEVVTNLVSQIYQLASVMDSMQQLTYQEQTAPGKDFVATNLPLPLVILNKDDTVVFANRALMEYIHVEADDIIGKNFYSIIDLSFPSEHTLANWLAASKKGKAVATRTWERVRINLSQESEQQAPICDIAAYYNQGNPQDLETMLVFFDHTNQYAQDEQAISFVALAVHELRAPLTVLRGYIEAFEEELSGKLSPELDDFMKKMAVSAQQLSGFVNTILNVSRVENDQFELKLHRESWQAILQRVVSDLSLRAEVRGIHLTLQLPQQLPAVAVDQVSIYEVLSNLIDNAIKYSNGSSTIAIKASERRDGQIETTVQDFGVGIPQSAIAHIFNKFYRNHRNRAQIGGTGLGLYLSKAIVTAHGGQIWVNSTEGKGSTFGFTLMPYSQVAADGQKPDNEKGIVRNAHGWIKNHSLYRR